MPRAPRQSILLALSLAFMPSLAAAQPFGTLHWQLQPFCNRVTATINQDGAVYTLDGFDDQCGASQRAPLVGTAVPNPDGTVGLGFTVTVAGARAVHVAARVDPGTGSGTWVDSAGNTGAFALNASAAGAPRPVPSIGPAWGTVIQGPASPASPVGLGVVIATPTPTIGAAIAGQWGAIPTTMPSSPAAVIGSSRDDIGVLGSSTHSAGVAGTSTSGMGVAGESAQGPGVFGLSGSGPGVLAMSGSATPGGVALELVDGGLRVSGTVTPAFVVTATPANTAGHVTTLDHPLLNNAPNAMVFVTRVWGGAGGSTANITTPLSVFYTGTSWAIFREDGLGMPFDTRFNVLVVSR
jgi:hypothetical protein